uniref:Uncharacterized protein n=1 Tax=Pithovirus LCDPAC02 TaxID=2506601 RepID=A0A481YRU8_9VIRU|nr:MAG: hypothetical protein LCDPAC02_03730 [Pithovirus LCDPAC02]
MKISKSENELTLEFNTLNEQIEELTKKREKIKNDIKELKLYKKFERYNAIDYVTLKDNFLYNWKDINIKNIK